MLAVQEGTLIVLRDLTHRHFEENPLWDIKGEPGGKMNLDLKRPFEANVNMWCHGCCHCAIWYYSHNYGCCTASACYGYSHHATDGVTVTVVALCGIVVMVAVIVLHGAAA